MTQSTQSTAEGVVEESNETLAGEEEQPVVAETSEASEIATEDAPDEGDIAADYLEELLDIVDLDGDIEIEIRGDRTFISIQAEDGAQELQDLVGNKGEVLDALQELVRLSVLASTGHRTRLVLDINGHRQQRTEELKALAEKAIVAAKESGQSEHLSPMSAYERKIVHDVVAEAGLISESEGEGKRRHVVVSTS